MWKNKWKQKMKNEKGFMSIEAVMAMATILMVVLLSVGFFTYMMPRQAIEEEVHVLGRAVKMQGELKVSDIVAFQENMEKRGIVKKENKNDVKVKLSLEDTSGKTFLGYEDYKGTPIMRGAKINGSFVVMKLRVEVPANKKALTGAMNFFGGGNTLSDKHVFSERIMSEHYE